MKGKKKNTIKSIGKKTFAVSTSAILATTTVMGTMPSVVYANSEYSEVVTLADATKITRDEVSKITVKSIASNDSNSSIEHLMDGNIDTFMDSDYANHNNENLQWYQFALQDVVSISRVRIHPRTNSINGRPNYYKIYAGIDENNLSVVAEGNIDQNQVDWTDVSFEPVQANYVKVEITTSEENFSEYHVLTVSEIELYKNESSPIVEDVYALDGYQGEDGKVYVRLTGKPGKVADPSWEYSEINGEHYIVSKEALTAPNYDPVCVYGPNEEKSYWNYIYLDEKGQVSVSTTYNLQKPTATIQVGNEQMEVVESTITIAETFTDTPVLHVEGVNLEGVGVQAVGVGQNKKDIEVTGNKQSVDIPLVYTSNNKPNSGKYSISYKYGSSKSAYKTVIVTYTDCSAQREELRTAIDKAQALQEEDYTVETWGNLQAALTKGKEIAKNNIATKAQITDNVKAINTAIENLKEETKVNKTELKEKIDAYKDFNSTNEKYKIFENTLKKALEVYESSTATQEDVDYYTIQLEAHYYLVKVAELSSEYSYDKKDYSSYKTNTVIPVVKMYGITWGRLNGNYSENAENKGQMKQWYEDYQTAIKGLEQITKQDKYVGFFNDSDSSSKYQGNFSVIKEEIVDGKTKLTVRFDNNGIHPIYGESRPNASGETKYTKFSATAMNKKTARVNFYDENFKWIGTTYLENYQPLENESNLYNGFTASITINDSYAKAAYTVFEYYSDSFNQTYSPWYYKLDKKANTSKLQALYDKLKDYTSESAWYKQKFVGMLEKAREVLDNSEATQEEVDTAYNNLNKAYWLCEFGEIQKKYKLDNDNFDYTLYTTESILPLYKAYMLSNNYNWNTDVNDIKNTINDFTAAEKNLVKTTDVNTMRGLTEDGINVNNLGNFTVKQTDVFKENGKTMVKLHVEYQNTGIHPISGKVSSKLSTSDMNKFAKNMDYHYSTTSGSSGIKPIPDDEIKYLDGENSFTDGFQFDVTVESGVYSFVGTNSSKKISTVGEFYTSVEAEDDGSIVVSGDGNDETGTGTSESPVATLSKAIELVEKGGTIRLVSDINVDKLETKINKDITINGEGHSIIRPKDTPNAQSSLITVDNANVTFENVKLEGQSISKFVLNIKNKAKVILGKDTTVLGTTKNPDPIIMVDNAELEINGSRITKASGNALKLTNNATAVLTDGAIVDNKLTGVWVAYGSTFTMNGGEITNNGTGVSHDAESSSKVHLNAGKISGNKNELDVDGKANIDSYMEVKSGVLQGNLNVKNKTQTAVLPSDYKDILLGRANEEKFDSYVENVREKNANIDVPSGTQSLLYWLQPTTNDIKLSISKYDYVEEEGIYVYYIPVTDKGDVDTTRDIITIENASLTDKMIDVSTDKLVKNKAYVIVVGNYQVDTSKLEALVTDVQDYYRNTSVYLNEFKPALEKAKAVLEKENATQEEIDNAFEALEKAYARCQIQDYLLDYYYRPDEKLADYETNSALSLYTALGNAQNLLDENNSSTEELKAFIKGLDEKKAGLVEVKEGTVKVEKGFNKDAIKNKNNVGYFTVTEKPIGDKIMLHVEYHNDGINHFTNEKLGEVDFSIQKNYRVYINNKYYTKENNGGISSTKYVDGKDFKPLHGETDLSKGFQFDFEADPGNITFEIRQIKPATKKITYSLGTYLTDVDKNAPIATDIYKNEDGSIRVEFSEPVEIKDSSWKKSDKSGETDGRVWIGTLTEDKLYDVSVTDLAGNYVTFTVDHKSPIVESIHYVEKDFTNKNVKVYVRFDEPINVVDEKQNPGWKYDKNHLMATKEYAINTIENVKFCDETGNTVDVKIEVNNIDKEAPVITLHGVEPDGITKDKVTYSIKEQNIDKIIIDGVEYTEENAPKEITDLGKHTITVIDKAGNETSVSFTIVESVKPTVTVKESSKGTEGHYSKLDLKLYDASGIDYVVVNGKTKDLTNNVWSDLNDDNVNYVEGHNVVEVYDIYGNKTVFEFDYDTVVPEVTVKESSKGTEGHYSKLDLKLHDNKGIDYVVVNGVKKDLVNNAWSDLNDDSVNYVEGHNVVEVYDIYGNKTIFEFDYDTIAPVIYAEDITIKKNSTFDPLKKVIATDNGKDYTSSIIVVENNVNTKKVGKYEVKYSVTDLAGNTTEKTIIVTVENKKSCWDSFVDMVEGTIKVVEDIVHGILDWIF